MLNQDKEFNLKFFKKTKSKLLNLIIILIFINPVFVEKKAKEDDKKIPEPIFITYEEIIPDTAITKISIFKTHENDNKLYYEISTAQLGKELNFACVTAELHHSMITLPEKLMQPPIFDHYIGFFTSIHEDFSSDKHEIKYITYIKNWHLEKKNPSTKVNEPV